MYKQCVLHRRFLCLWTRGRGEATACLRECVRLLAWHDLKQPWSKHRRVPLVVSCAVSRLVSVRGADAVMAALAEVGTTHAAIDFVLADLPR